MAKLLRKSPEKATAQTKKTLFARGEKGFAMEKRWEQEKEQASRKARSFGLKPGEKARIILLDDAVIFYKAHSGKKGPDTFYTKPCLDQAVDEEGNSEICPYCENDIRWTVIYVAGTVINCTGFENDEGKAIAYYKQLLSLKSEAKNTMLMERKDLSKKRGKDAPLALTMWEVRRGKSKKSLGSGEYFKYLGSFKNKKALFAYLKKQGVQKDDWNAFLTPFDYEEVLAPETEDQARRFLGVPSGGKEGGRIGRRKNDDFDDDDDTAIEDDISFD